MECFTLGLVKDGGIRDMNAIMGYGFMVFAGGRTPAARARSLQRAIAFFAVNLEGRRCFPEIFRLEVPHKAEIGADEQLPGAVAIPVDHTGMSGVAPELEWLSGRIEEQHFRTLPIAAGSPSVSGEPSPRLAASIGRGKSRFGGALRSSYGFVISTEGWRALPAQDYSAYRKANRSCNADRLPSKPPANIGVQFFGQISLDSRSVGSGFLPLSIRRLAPLSDSIYRMRYFSVCDIICGESEHGHTRKRHRQAD